ncbi:MAG: Ribosomal large subunit pseudouridine synthase [Pseudomonadota bacterium]|jgi:23S rRNA pseudouridine2605 synthase
MRSQDQDPSKDSKQTSPTKTQRLHKLLAQSGIGSRREMEKYIEAGRVHVNDSAATLGQLIHEHDIIKIDGKTTHLFFDLKFPKILIYHKPEGEIVSVSDPQKRTTVFSKLPRIKNEKWISIGRLDINTSGLLMFTTSGDLANRLMHPKFEIEREYAVRIFGELTEEQISKLKSGVKLDDGLAKFDEIRYQGGEGANRWYQVILMEGRNREVRRLFEYFNLPVSRLIRTRFGPVSLPSRVKRGMMLELEVKEVEKILKWLDMPFSMVSRNESLNKVKARKKHAHPSPYAPKVKLDRKAMLDKKIKKIGRKPVKRRIRSDSDIKKI